MIQAKVVARDRALAGLSVQTAKLEINREFL